ncbi:YSC84-related protein [Shimia sp.]|uniref:lipid-binding SYLF domain-containing protein n=1 Tax=Shimia sp. TaxID=1954381 RepID=UPI0035668C65
MDMMNRRSFTLAALAGAGLTAACGNGIGGNGAAEIDARVDQTLDYLYSNHPNARDLASKSSGILVMPLITEAGFGVGGGYGRGALLVNDVTVDYYSAAKGSFGFQIGASQHAHVLFFMTENALSEFRRSRGWAAGADLKYAVADDGETLAVGTTTSLAPVIAVVFGQAGLHFGATLEGTKYSRIIP